MGNKFPPKDIKNLKIYENLECVSIGDNNISKIEDVSCLAFIETIV
jgi:hypothetical protein